MAKDPTKASSIGAGDIPVGVVVMCPMDQQLVSPATSCFACPHNGGIAILNDRPAAVASISWEQRHMMLCRYRRKIPMQRVGARAPAVIGLTKIAAG